MKTWLYIVFILLTGWQSNAQQTSQDSLYRLSLEEARQLALQRNKQVLNAQLDILKAKKKVWETTAIGLPQVTGGFSHNYNIDLPVTLVPARMFNPQAPEGTYAELRFGTEHNSKATLSVSQLIFNGSYIVGLQTAKVFKQLSETKLKQTERDIIASVTETYYLVLITRENARIIDSNYVFVKKLYEETRKMFEAGMVGETNVKQMEFNLKNMENARQTVRRQLEVAKSLLKLQMGLDLACRIELTDSLGQMEAAVQQGQELTEKPLVADQTIDYRLIETQERLQELALKNEKAALLPSIGAFYNHQESMMGDEIKWFDEDGKWYKANIIGFNINIPIFGSGQKLARISQARIELDKVHNQKWQMQQNLTMKILQAKVNLQNAISNYRTQKENKELSEFIYESTRIKYMKGMASGLELTQAQLQYFGTLQQYYQAILEFWKAKNELDKMFYQ